MLREVREELGRRGGFDLVFPSAASCVYDGAVVVVVVVAAVVVVVVVVVVV